MEWTEEPSNNQTQATMTIAATESPKLHPTLVKLGYPGWGCTVSALSILDCLLKDGAVKENDVERTCQRLANPISGNNEKATQDSVQKPSSSLVVLSTEQSTKPQQHNNNKDTTMKQDKKKKKKTTTTVKKKQKQKSDPIPQQLYLPNLSQSHPLITGMALTMESRSWELYQIDDALSL